MKNTHYHFPQMNEFYKSISNVVQHLHLLICSGKISDSEKINAYLDFNSSLDEIETLITNIKTKK